MTDVRAEVDRLVCQLIAAQRAVAIAAGPLVALPNGTDTALLQRIEEHYKGLVTAIFEETGNGETLIPGESGTAAGAILGRIGILANALSRHVNALDDSHLAGTGLKTYLEHGIGEIDQLVSMLNAQSAQRSYP